MFGKHAVSKAVAAVLFSAAASTHALAQSPYQGAWSGTYSYRSTSTCTAGALTYNQICSGTDPWTGSVSANGRLTVFRYTGTSVCTSDIAPNANYFSSPGDPAPFSYGVINASGTISVPAVTVNRIIGSTTVTGVCPATTFQFTGATMSNSITCSQTSHDVSAVITDCTGSNASSWTGTKGAVALSSPPPIFPITVISTITTNTVNATAQIQPRAQDVGTNASIFVFAHAPSNLVHGTALYDRAPVSPPIAAAAKDAVVCVLAQVDASGQLVAVSASTMQALLSGVLTTQSQSLTLLSNVPTPNVAGATFFVGYGGSAAAMLSSGVFQTAFSVPGAVQCTAQLDAAPAPKSPGALTGLWWNAAESGWGISFTQRGSNTFAAWYTYDAAGKPKWYVSTCAGAGATGGTCNGVIYEVAGPAYFGAAFNASMVNAVDAGTLQATFRDAGNATMTYTVAGQTRTVALTRQPLGTGTTPPAVDYTDLWWNPNESGWGMSMTQQFGVTFLAWYVFDSNGKPTWLVATCAMSGSTCSGSLFRTRGPGFGPTFDATQVQATSVGTVIVSFLDANNAVLSYSVDGVSATKSITRQLF